MKLSGFAEKTSVPKQYVPCTKVYPKGGELETESFRFYTCTCEHILNVHQENSVEEEPDYGHKRIREQLK